MTTIPRQGNSLKAVIKQHGYKLYQVADGIRLPLRTLSEYCSGRVYVPVSGSGQSPAISAAPLNTSIWYNTSRKNPHQEVTI